MLKVTLLTKEMKEQYRKLYDDNIHEMGGRSCRPNYGNTLVLLDEAGNLMSAVTFSYSIKKRQFTEMHMLTQTNLRKKGYAKLLLNAFARTVSRIPEFQGADTCIIHCETDNVEGLKYHENTAKYVGTHRDDYGSGRKEYAEFSQDISVWLNYTPVSEYEIDDVVGEKFLTRVMQFKIR